MMQHFFVNFKVFGTSNFIVFLKVKKFVNILTRAVNIIVTCSWKLTVCFKSCSMISEWTTSSYEQRRDNADTIGTLGGLSLEPISASKLRFGVDMASPCEQTTSAPSSAAAQQISAVAADDASEEASRSVELNGANIIGSDGQLLPACVDTIRSWPGSVTCTLLLPLLTSWPSSDESWGKERRIFVIWQLS